MATFFKNKMMFWLFLTQKKANKEKTVMTLTAELTFQKILSSIELDSDCVASDSEFGTKSWRMHFVSVDFAKIQG